MKLAEFIPQQVNLFKKEHGPILAKETEKRLKELLTSEGDAELDDELVTIMLHQNRSLPDYNEATQKVYWAIWGACKDFFEKESKR